MNFSSNQSLCTDSIDDWSKMHPMWCNIHWGILQKWNSTAHHTMWYVVISIADTSLLPSPFSVVLKEKVSNWTNIYMRRRCFCCILRALQALGLLLRRPESKNKKLGPVLQIFWTRNPFCTDCYCFDVHLQPSLAVYINRGLSLVNSWCRQSHKVARH